MSLLAELPRIARLKSPLRGLCQFFADVRRRFVLRQWLIPIFAYTLTQIRLHFVLLLQ
jgi:hypothetical protein